jgi:NO-binding membrane sensor protein with MHYT domain
LENFIVLLLSALLSDSEFVIIMGNGEQVHTHVSSVIRLVSFFLSFMGAYSAVSLAEQHRISGSLKPKLVSRSMYLVIMAIALGAGCMWSMHFIGMSAVIYVDPDDEIIELQFDVVITFLSMVACVALVYAGLRIASNDKMFCREKEEIFKLIVSEGQKESMDAVRSKYYLLKVALFRGTGPLLAGGVISGGGFCVMSYVGMLAIYAPLKVHWNFYIVALSVLISIFASTISFWIMFRALALYPTREILRLLSSLAAAVAVFGTHYTGMLAATHTLDPSPPPPYFGSVIPQRTANGIVLFFSIITTWVVSMVVQAELRAWHKYLRDRLHASRKTLTQLMERYDTDPLLLDYEEKNGRAVTTFEVDRSTKFTVSVRSTRAMDARILPEKSEAVDDIESQSVRPVLSGDNEENLEASALMNKRSIALESIDNNPDGHDEEEGIVS